MPHIGAPKSTVFMPVLLAIMGPIVEPHGESFLTTNSLIGTFPLVAIALIKDEETRSVA